MMEMMSLISYIKDLLFYRRNGKGMQLNGKFKTLH